MGDCCLHLGSIKMEHECLTLALGLVDNLRVHLAFHQSRVIDMEVYCVLGICIYYCYRFIAPLLSLVCPHVSTVAIVKTHVAITD